MRLVVAAVFGVVLPGFAAAQTPGLLGDAGGVRTALGNLGITLNVSDSENLLGDVSGGVKQGATLQGVTTADVQVDTGKALGLAGGTVNVSALQIHGRSLSAYYLDNLQAANGNEADDATRLWELWYDQTIGANADVKLGQQSIDNEFMVSTNSGLFVNTMAGWPLVPSDDLFAGGPAYPLSSLGARVLVKPAGNVTLLAGVFDDDPPGDAFDDDPQEKDAGGVRFSLRSGALMIAEAQLARPGGVYRLGFWVDTGRFVDQETGAPHKGNTSIYGVVDQSLAPNVNVFARLMGAPDAQNLIDFSLNGGVTLSAPLAARPNDMAGIDFGLAKVSGRAAALDREGGGPVRSTEELVELTYQAQAAPWLVVQPDVQFIVHPGGGIVDPDDGARMLGDEVVAGIRAVTSF